MAYRNDGAPSSSTTNGDRPTTYLLEHLATFTVSKESGIVFPADGMRRLLQLEKTTGIWSQKMQLCLDKQWVIIVDYNSGNEIERFSATTIEEPTAFTSNNPMEIYNNVLVIIVRGNSGNRSEMHIFQCQSISAVHLVENLKLLRSGKPMIQHQTSRGASVYREQQQPTTTTDSENDSIIDESQFNNHSKMTVSSQKYELEVKMLNHCFDDIEKFIARLQHASAAARELERRHMSKKSKRKDPGDGLLAIRTKPPYEKEFMDILAKFKLSFNLLARLKSQIHDPNAPELVHFLFTPLALIIDALNDVYYDSNIPEHVILPLLSYEAINLLTNCVTSKESELWQSLGDAWRLSKDEWRGPADFYQPIFFNGWTPDYAMMDELNLNGGDTTPPKTNMSRKPSIVAYEEAVPEHYKSPGSPGFRSQFSSDSTEYNGGSGDIYHHRMMVGGGSSTSHAAAVGHHQDNIAPTTSGWLDEIVARNGKIVQVTYPRTANNDKELSVIRGEHLEVLDDTRKWWKARNRFNQIGHVPHTIVMPFNYSDNYGNFRRRNDSDSYDAVFELAAPPLSSTIMSETPINSSHQPSSDWIRNNHIEHENIHNKEEIVSKPIKKDDVPPPPAPPPPPPVTPAVASTSTLKRPSSITESRKSLTSTITSTQNDEMQVELRQMLTMFREKRNNLAIVKTPDIYIEQTATTDEVEKWLEKKGFSDSVIKKMHNINGNELFALKLATLKDVLGEKDGKRLASQIEIQRNISGYKTTRSSELQAKLARARMKTEKDEQF